MARRPLRFESLEQRRLLAVDVSLRSGDLTIRGDGEDDEVELVWQADGGLLVTANNEEIEFTAAQIAADLRDDILINLGGGANVLSIRRDDPAGPLGRIRDDLTITGGNDGNAISIEGLMCDDLTITVGGGADEIEIVDSVIRRDAKITSGQGDDVLLLSRVDVGRDLLMNDTAGEDEVNVVDVVVSDDLHMRLLGAGGNTVNVLETTVRDDLKIDTGEGADELLLAGTLADSLLLATAGGDDQVILVDFDATDELRVRLGGGDDGAYLSGSTIGDNAVFEGQDGADSIVINATLVADDIRVAGGTGDDEIALRDVIVDNVKLEGGDGMDEISVDDVTILRKLTIVGGNGGDVVAMRDSSISQDARLQTGNGDDQVLLENILIHKGLNIETGNEDDAIVLDGSTEIGGALAVDGGRGNNNVENSSTSLRISRMKNVSLVDKDEIDRTAFDDAFADVDALIVGFESLLRPVFTSSASRSVAENMTLVGVVSAETIPPGQTVTYTITGGADADKFTLSDGLLSFTDAPDFEAPTDADLNNAYEVTVQADDGERTSIQTITVTVTSVNESDPTITSSSSVDVAENATAVTTLTATDPDLPVETLTFTLAGGADEALFQITDGNMLTFITAPDFESPSDADANNLYEVNVQVSDGERTSIQTITVTVLPVNEFAPTFTSPPNASVAENTTAVMTVVATDADLPTQAVTYSIVGGADAGKFELTNGMLSFTGVAPDFEDPTDASTLPDNVYEVIVRADDGNGHTTDQTIAVTVTDVVE